MAQVGRQPAEKAASEGPNPRERMQGQKAPLRTPGPGRFILTNPDAKGPLAGPTGARQIDRLPKKSFAISGKEGVDRG
jgi:hypothetical protein